PPSTRRWDEEAGRRATWARCRSDASGRLARGDHLSVRWNDHHAPRPAAPGERLSPTVRHDVEMKALDGAAAVLGVVPPESLDPDTRMIRDQLRIDGHDAEPRIRPPHRRRPAV